MNFKEWLLSEDMGTGAKQTLYPLSYSGIGLYSIPDYMNWSADSVTYIPPENRFLKFKWGKGMLSNPFKNGDVYPSIENLIANQIEVGSLKADGKNFDKSAEYVRKIPNEGGRQTEITPRKDLTMPVTKSTETKNSACKKFCKRDLP